MARAHGFVLRRIPLGADDFGQCLVAFVDKGDRSWVVLRDADDLASLGFLTAAFEYVASLLEVEACLRGMPRPIEFFHQRRLGSGWAALEQVVLHRDGLVYRCASWRPARAEVSQALQALTAAA